MKWCLPAASDIQRVLSLLRGAVMSPFNTHSCLYALKVQAAICAKVAWKGFTAAGDQASATRGARLCVAAVVVLGGSWQRLIQGCLINSGFYTGNNKKF